MSNLSGNYKPPGVFATYSNLYAMPKRQNYDNTSIPIAPSEKKALMFIVQDMFNTKSWMKFVSEKKEVNVMSNNNPIIIDTANEITISQKGLIKVSGNGETDEIVISAPEIKAGEGINVSSTDDELYISIAEIMKVGSKTLSENAIDGKTTGDFFLYYDAEQQEVQYVSVEGLASKIIHKVVEKLPQQNKEEIILQAGPTLGNNYIIRNLTKRVIPDTELVYLNGLILKNGEDYEIMNDAADTAANSKIKLFDITYASPENKAYIDVIYHFIP